jgi:hypothetical protein
MVSGSVVPCKLIKIVLVSYTGEKMLLHSFSLVIK